ncbi:MAG TPA: hypothetical protein HA254_05180 [Candidatus Diapherotrites archaeon]|uniref:Ribonuclease P protein component 2 n=1 Tax=Candidatus Iainarchaeum sp. TaxID=3101447 RepID=A0A7J4IYW0_9ARCH|nr:hypothetical protein [Candidatus Diapherotrites archaeon]
MAAKKKSLNPIPLSLRGKKRYVKFRLLSPRAFSEKELWESVLATFGSIFGGKGVADQRLWLIKWIPEKSEGIVRCSMEETEGVKAGLLFVDKISGVPVIPLIVKVSGSVKKLK